MKRIEHERMYIPVEAFRFWEQKDFKELLAEVMDKSAFFKINPEEEKDQGIAYLFLEMFKIRRQINVLNMQPELVSRFFNQKWQKPMTGYRFIKNLCKLKCNGIKKMFKEMPVFTCDNEVTTATNYLIMALTAYKATAEVIFDRLVNVTIVCQIIKPLIVLNFPWDHGTIFTLIRSASNIFLMKLLSEFYDLKSKLLEKEEQIVKDMHGNSIEEKTLNIVDWFIQEEVKEKPKSNPSSASKPKRKRGNQKTFSIESTQEDNSNLPSVGCRIRMCVGYDDKGNMSAVIITPKEDVDYQFWYPKRNRVINEYKHIKDNYSWSDEVVKESEYAKGATSPKIYDLRTPQKKSETKKTHSSEFSDNWYSSDSSDMVVKPIKDYKSMGQTEPIRLSKTIVDSKPTHTKSSNIWESSKRDKSQLSIVDRILMEESSCDKQSKTGSVNKAKKLQLNFVEDVYSHG